MFCGRMGNAARRTWSEAMTDTLKRCREEFEHWCAKQGLYTERRKDDDRYERQDTRGAWSAWRFFWAERSEIRLPIAEAKNAIEEALTPFIQGVGFPMAVGAVLQGIRQYLSYPEREVVDLEDAAKEIAGASCHIKGGVIYGGISFDEALKFATCCAAAWKLTPKTGEE